MFAILHQGLMEKQLFETVSRNVKSVCFPGWKVYHLDVAEDIHSCLLRLLPTAGNSSLQNQQATMHYRCRGSAAVVTLELSTHISGETLLQIIKIYFHFKSGVCSNLLV